AGPMSYCFASSARVAKEDMGQETLTSIADRIERIPHALTVHELMAILRVSNQTIYRMCTDQTIPFFLVRRSYRFDQNVIAEWLSKQSMKADLIAQDAQKTQSSVHFARNHAPRYYRAV